MAKRDDPTKRDEAACDSILRRVHDAGLADDQIVGNPQAGVPGWEVIGRVAEGLAFAARPLDWATDRVAASYDVGRRGPFILTLLSRGVRHPAELASVFRVGRSLITAELNRLVVAGLIVTTTVASDGRKSELTLTAEGRQAADSIRAEMTRIIGGNLRDYTPDQLELFIRMLRDVRRPAD